MTDKQLIQWLINKGCSEAFAKYLVLAYDVEFKKVK